MKQPWIKLFTRETLGALATFTAAERGVWFSILCVLSESDERGVRALPTDRWASACNCGKEQFDRVMTVLRAERAFDFDDTAVKGCLQITCRRMVKETRELEMHAKRQRKYDANSDAISDGASDGKMTEERKREEKEKENFPPHPPYKEKGKEESKESVRASGRAFKKPTLEEVEAYCAERKNGVDAKRWHDYYVANGWRVGRNPMKDWQAAVRTWERVCGSGIVQCTSNRLPSKAPKHDDFFA